MMMDSLHPLYYLQILVIDDSPKFVKRFSQAIERLGHEVVGTTDTQKAIKLIEDSYKNLNPFDAVFIDYLMAGMNGVYVAQKLKEIDPELVLIAITREESTETKMMIVDSLAFRLLITKNILRAHLRKLLNILVSTKTEQYSGDRSRLSRKLAADQQRAREQQKNQIGEKHNDRP